MTVDREIIIDLLPAYFSGEASKATQALVEDYFRQNPDFERIARTSNRPLEGLQVPSVLPDQSKEKLALERTRELLQTRTSFFWVATIFSLLVLLFRIHDHKVIWILWDGSQTVGIIFSFLAVFFWLGYSYLRRRKEPMPQHAVYMWLAVLYSLMLLLFRFDDHKIIWIVWSSSLVPGIVFTAVAIFFWIAAFVMRRKAIQKDNP
jgi:hypothetical protein